MELPGLVANRILVAPVDRKRQQQGDPGLRPKAD